MADQDQHQAVDTDYSGRPYHRPAAAEIAAASVPSDCPYAAGVDLPDGRFAIHAGGGYYLTGDGGWPDWDRPVHIEGLSPGSPGDGDLIIRIADYDG